MNAVRDGLVRLPPAPWASLAVAVRSLTLEQMVGVNYAYAVLYAALSLAFFAIGLVQMPTHLSKGAVFVAFGATLVCSSVAFAALARTVRKRRSE